MKIITSLQNELIKDLKKQKANNKGLLFLDGAKLIEEAINSYFKPKIILLNETQTLVYQNYNFLKKVNPELIILVNKKIIDAFTEVKTSQGIIGVFFNKRVELNSPNGNFLVLDNLQDAGNVGTLLRSALGAGFKDVYLLNCASASNIKTIRSSMGAVFKLDIYEIDTQTFIEVYKKTHYPLYGTDMKGKSIYNFNFQTPCGVVLGNEGQGISEELKEILTDTLTIPIDANLESLNVGVAGSIIIFQIKNKGEI
ncbi:MAG: RNA methyltransferase [Clostridia bacterium]|nr:RNA methyltransferase [Clostridia bacterium]MDD4686073.1 RNA methyltransferase [Clostridia bacterium]